MEAVAGPRRESEQDRKRAEPAHPRLPGSSWTTSARARRPAPALAQVLASARERRSAGPAARGAAASSSRRSVSRDRPDGLAGRSTRVRGTPARPKRARGPRHPGAAPDRERRRLPGPLQGAGSRSECGTRASRACPSPTPKFVRTPTSQPEPWTLIVERLTQSPTAGGLHGNQIVGVLVQPGAAALDDGGQHGQGLGPPLLPGAGRRTRATARRRRSRSR